MHDLTVTSKRVVLLRVGIVCAALFVASAACTLNTGDSDSPTQTPFPSLTPTTWLTATPEGFLTPTPTGAAVQDSTQVPPTQVNCTPQTGWPVYTVVAGDTLSGIAVRSGATVDQLVQANCLASAELIYIGQKLYVPSLPPTSTPAPTATPTVTPNPDAPVIQQNLNIKPHWLDQNGLAVTYADTVRLDLGEVIDALSVTFYVNDPGGGDPINIGQDGDPWDGAFWDYAFPETGSYTFWGIARNDEASSRSTSFTIRYDPNFVPPEGQYNVLSIAPVVEISGGTVFLQPGAVVTITWDDGPRGADQVDFVLTPTGSDATDGAKTLGSDTSPADGIALTWAVPQGLLGYVQAIATMPDGSTLSSEMLMVEGSG
ncbi:MAG: LysM peptidoglycan-binding domain-containing protein [Anaerolineae bacterium]|nr:LysM peptidoglycan-binding domain-containing protein [Anaerolineae bacterium]